MSYHELRCLGHEWGDLPIIFRSDEVTSENHWIVIYGNECIFYFLHAICPEQTILLKQLSIADFVIVAKDSIFWFSIVTSPQMICDVTRM